MHPECLDINFFQKVIQKCINLPASSTKITDLKIESATTAGDNYLSDIFRAIVTYSTPTNEINKISLIIKSMESTDTRGPCLEELQSYEKEKEMYEIVCPSISKIINEVFAAKLFYSTKDPFNIIVFEDLKALGFTMADRKALLNLNHCNLVLSKLGRFHASSMVLAKQNPNLMKIFNFGMFHPNGIEPAITDNVFVKGLETLTQVVDEWEGYEEIASKMKKIQINFVEKIRLCVSHDDDELCVLNHGDMWVNNFMFKYSEANQRATSVIFLDYQLSFYASPGIDLNYFFNTSPMGSVRENHRDDLIDVYYEAFSGALKALGSTNIPSHSDICKEIKRKEFYGFVAAVGVLPLVLNIGKSETGGVEAFADENVAERMRLQLYKAENYQKAMKYILKRFNDLRILDF